MCAYDRSKLNLAACIFRMHELDSDDLPEGSLDHAVNAINEVIEKKAKEPKPQFRKAQLLILQGDLDGAKNCLAECKRLGGEPRDVREALQKVKALEKEARERERALYGGKIQTSSVHQAEAVIRAAADARKARIYKVLYALGLPLILPAQLVLMGWRALVPLFGKLLGRGKAKDE